MLIKDKYLMARALEP